MVIIKTITIEGETQEVNAVFYICYNSDGTFTVTIPQGTPDELAEIMHHIAERLNPYTARTTTNPCDGNLDLKDLETTRAYYQENYEVENNRVKNSEEQFNIDIASERDEDDFSEAAQAVLRDAGPMTPGA